MDGRRTEGCISSRYHFSFLNGRRSPPARAYVAVSFEQVNTEKVYADTLLGFRQAEKKKKKKIMEKYVLRSFSARTWMCGKGV